MCPIPVGYGVLDSCFKILNIYRTSGANSIFNKSIFSLCSFSKIKELSVPKIWKEKLKKYSKNKLIINKKSKIKYFKY